MKTGGAIRTMQYYLAMVVGIALYGFIMAGAIFICPPLLLAWIWHRVGGKTNCSIVDNIKEYSVSIVASIAIPYLYYYLLKEAIIMFGLRWASALVALAIAAAIRVAMGKRRDYLEKTEKETADLKERLLNAELSIRELSQPSSSQR